MYRLVKSALYHVCVEEIPSSFRLEWLFTVKDMFALLSGVGHGNAHSDTGISLCVAVWRWAEGLHSLLGRLVCSLALPSTWENSHKASSVISTLPYSCSADMQWMQRFGGAWSFAYVLIQSTYWGSTLHQRKHEFSLYILLLSSMLSVSCHKQL